MTALATRIRDFVDEVIAPRALEMSRGEGPPPDQLVRSAGEQGMAGLLLPRQLGGAGCSHVEFAGFIEAVAGKYAGQIPLILKLNNSDSLSKGHSPESAVTGSVKDAVRLGCVAIGYTIYPGSAARNHQYENLRALIEEAKASGLAAVTWSYPRGEGITDKKGETAVDVAAYAAQIACQLGSHVVKVKPPGEFIFQPEAQKIFERYSIPWKTLADRTRHVVQSCFNGKRVVIFSGGEAKGTDEILTEIRGLRDGGAFGSIMGRNAFQRPREEAIKLLREVMDIYLGK